ncbi:MAG: aldo/keto reductase [Pseudomonadota bacterium]
MSGLITTSGMPVSRLCFGAMQFGGGADKAASREMYSACRAAGVNFFDTAHGYTSGLSETWLGAFAGPERDDVIIATKVGYTGGAGRKNILAQFDESRARLQMETLDILYMHRFDPDTPLKETFGTLAELRAAGAIRYIGVSNYAAWQVMKAQSVAAAMGTRINIIQPMYSLVKRQAEVELLPMAASENIAVAGYSPLGAGLLTGKDANSGDGRLATDPRYAARYGEAWMHQAGAALTALAKKMGCHPAALAVAWAARHPAVTAPIISARNTDQLAPSLAAMSTKLSDADYAALSALSPTPAPATDRLEEA